MQALYNNVWRDVFKAYLQSYALFANGNYANGQTASGYAARSDSDYGVTTPSVSIVNNMMKVGISNVNAGGTVFFNNAIDFTNYSKAIIEFGTFSRSGNWLYIVFANNKQNGYTLLRGDTLLDYTSANATVNIDISSVNQAGYFGFFMVGSGGASSVEVKKVVLS